MGQQEQRRNAIKDIIRNQKVDTQQELTELLCDAGFVCNQSTVSRDISDLGLIKDRTRGYVLAQDRRLTRLLDELEVSAQAANNIVVLHTADGAAAGVAGALDKAGLPGVLGTVAGDDTIFLVTETSAQARFIQQRINRL